MVNSVRVTQASISRTMLAGLQLNLSRMQTLQEQLSSGRALNRPSDNPSAAVAAMQYRSDISRTTQYQRNAQDGLSWLGSADTTLTGSLELLGRARDLTVTGSTASSSPESRNALAVEIDQLRDTLLAVANTQQLGRPLFGGTTTSPTAYVKDAATGIISYVGDSGQVTRTIGAGAPIVVNVDHDAVFGPAGTPGSAGPPPVPPTAGTDLFAVLAKISDDLRSNTAGLATDLTDLDTAMKRVQNVLSDVGARYNRVEMMGEAAASSLISLGQDLTNVENVDLPKAILDLKMQELAYQAALGATAKAIQPSLVDFLR